MLKKFLWQCEYKGDLQKLKNDFNKNVYEENRTITVSLQHYMGSFSHHNKPNNRNRNYQD